MLWRLLAQALTGILVDVLVNFLVKLVIELGSTLFRQHKQKMGIGLA